MDTWNWNDRFTLIVLTVLTTGERFKRRNLLIFVAFKIQLIVINLSINFDFILLISISLITYFCFRILKILPRCFILEAIFNISCLSRWQIRFRNTCERLRHHDLGELSLRLKGHASNTRRVSCLITVKQHSRRHHIPTIGPRIPLPKKRHPLLLLLPLYLLPSYRRPLPLPPPPLPLLLGRPSFLLPLLNLHMWLERGERLAEVGSRETARWFGQVGEGGERISRRLR